MDLFEEVFGYKTPDKMLLTLHNLKRVDSYNQEEFSIEATIVNFGNKGKKMPESVNKNKGKEILKIVSKILDFNLNKQNQRGQELKILTPSQMLSRSTTSLAQLKAGNNSENLKTKSGNYCILFTDQKILQNNSIKV